MKKRNADSVIELKNTPGIISSAACVGKTEQEGPLSEYFDICFPDDGIGQTSWEKAESELLRTAVETALDKAGLPEDEIGIVFAGDLMNQCTASTYALRESNIPLCGLFGACSTMALSLALSALVVDGNFVSRAVAAACSHFCSAEKQFRYPLEYGGQRAPAAQRTVTGAGAFVVGGKSKDKVIIPRVLIGKITDAGITDTSNMGAAMAPAAADSIARFLNDTNTAPSDYDMILTGDLGKVGSELLKDIMLSDYDIDISTVHNDCGLLIYDMEKQDVHSGGSGCGCSAAVLSAYIMKKMKEGLLKKVLFAGTGALMSPLISLQGESIPSIAHIVQLNFGEE